MRFVTGRWLLVLPLLALLGGCDGDDVLDSEGPDFPEGNQYVEGDFTAHIESIQASMPRRGSEGFHPPTESELDHWRTLVESLLDADTSAADSLVAEHFSSYTVVRFTDIETEQTYLLLQEEHSVEKGWGVVAVNPASIRDLTIEVPHPVYDLDTHREGADVFRETQARVLIMAGTHRCANRQVSLCDGSSDVCGDGEYHLSDMAHVVAAPFQVTHEVVSEHFPEVTAVSLHGNGREECEDVFLSNGIADSSNASLRDLGDALVERGVQVGRPETSSCPLVGSTNVQGRFTNESPNPCTESASSLAGTFIHVEQRRGFRETRGAYRALIEALNATFE